MRETRQSGSEGGVARECHPYPYHETAGNRLLCRPGPLTGRFLNRLLSSGFRQLAFLHL